MPVILTDSEKAKKNMFELITFVIPDSGSSSSLFKPVIRGSDRNIFEYDFHFAMQNPKKGIVYPVRRAHSLLSDEDLESLADYFTQNGAHIFGKTIDELALVNVNLHTNGRIKYITRLIEKNPDIKIMDFSMTRLENEDVPLLIEALKKNTKLKSLKLAANALIDDDMLATIAEIFKERNEVPSNSSEILPALNTDALTSTPTDNSLNDAIPDGKALLVPSDEEAEPSKAPIAHPSPAKKDHSFLFNCLAAAAGLGGIALLAVGLAVSLPAVSFLGGVFLAASLAYGVYSLFAPKHFKPNDSRALSEDKTLLNEVAC